MKSTRQFKRKTLSRKNMILLGGASIAASYAIFCGGFVLGQNRPANKQESRVSNPVHVLKVSDISVYDLWSLTNATRIKNDLHPLSLSYQLNESAAAKCHDMAVKKYWDHKDPSGRQPWHFIVESGITYKYAGENLADNFDSAEAAYNGWMNSQEHRNNILSPHFGRVGFAVCKVGALPGASIGPSLLVVQHFTD